MPAPTPPSAFSEPDFRAALGMFATGVTVITARTPDGVRVGFTANSFNSVSMTPPLVLWSLARSAGSMPGMLAATHYAVNVLAANQKELAQRFARKGVDRFVGVACSEGLGGAPLLPGAVASFECAGRSRHEEGDHLIFVAEVLRCTQHGGARPLLFHGGRYYAEHPL